MPRIEQGPYNEHYGRHGGIPNRLAKTTLSLLATFAVGVLAPASTQSLLWPVAWLG